MTERELFNRQVDDLFPPPLAERVKKHSAPFDPPELSGRPLRFAHLSSLFYWDRTPEGHDFWSQVGNACSAKDLPSAKNLPPLE